MFTIKPVLCGALKFLVSHSRWVSLILWICRFSFNFVDLRLVINTRLGGFAYLGCTKKRSEIVVSFHPLSPLH